jgi:hypothetical protein
MFQYAVIPAQAGIQSLNNLLQSKNKLSKHFDKTAGFPPARE